MTIPQIVSSDSTATSGNGESFSTFKWSKEELNSWLKPSCSSRPIRSRSRCSCFSSLALRADALRVAGSREVSQNGQWVAAPLRAATVQKLEAVILTKARDLRRSSITG